MKKKSGHPIQNTKFFPEILFSKLSRTMPDKNWGAGAGVT